MPKKKKPTGAPEEVQAIRERIAAAFNLEDATGRRAGDAKYGVYAFFDFDGEPIYVGQTAEKLRGRIGRHLTNQRTDAVAMSVLDPFEVLDLKMWPLWRLEGAGLSDKEIKQELNNAEFTAYEEAVAASSYGAVLNEQDMAKGSALTTLPEPVQARIVPEELIPLRKHPDVRIARRAQTIASLAKVISERDPSKGLRRTLVTQARRLERLADDRHREINGEEPREAPGEETGEELAGGEQAPA